MPTVLIGGGSGLIGTRLSQLLREKGFEVLHLSRQRRPNASFETYQWDAKAGTIDEEALERADYVVNVAGAGVADKPWTDRRKQAIIASRVNTNRLLKAKFQEMNQRPKAYLSASAIGYYGDRGDEELRESSAPGSGFLPESVSIWEKAVDEVAQTGIRTVVFRTGIVLSVNGGALPRLKFPLKFFVAPYFGEGRQWYSWIHIDDICRCYIHAMENEALTGTFNAVAPFPVTNKELMQQLVKASGKPAVLMPVPNLALRLGLGEMADAILDSDKVVAEKLLNTGFEFNFPRVREALHDVLGRGV